MSLFSANYLALRFVIRVPSLPGAHSPDSLNALYAVFKVLLVGSSGLEPPRRLRRHLGAAMNVSPFAPLNDPPDRLAPSAPARTSRLSRSVCGSRLVPAAFVSSFSAAEKESGGLKWTRTTDLTLIRRAL